MNTMQRSTVSWKGANSALPGLAGFRTKDYHDVRRMSVVARRGQQICLMRCNMGKINYLYILSDQSNSVIALGITADLKAFLQSAKQKSGGMKLVYFEKHENLDKTMARERGLRSETRQEKLDLIERMNPQWLDLYDEL